MILKLIKKIFEFIHQKRSILNKTLFISKKRLWTFLTCFCLSSLFVFSQLFFSINPAFALPDICGEPGKDDPVALTGIINTYYPGTAATASAGSTSITVGSALGSTTPITAGDLLLVIQMQDALINSTDTDAYGDGIAGAPASGYTNLNSAGTYQYVVATNSVGLGGGTVNLAQALSVTYTNANADLVNGQRRYQVIRVPQYSSATISGTVRSYAWNGSIGGVVAADVASSLTFSGAGKIDVSGQGFRGGGGSNLGGTTGAAGLVNGIANVAYSSDYRHTAPSTNGAGLSPAPNNNNALCSGNCYDASKGEGIAGSPRWTRDGGNSGQDPNTITTVTDNGSANEGYPSGSFGRGAPANAGGGGSDPNLGQNAANTGGGGGANAGAGGRGGDSWTDNAFTAPVTDPKRQKVGGEGGAALPVTVNKIFFGGGGGAATANNTVNTFTTLPSGGGGGGMVIIRSGQLLGTGSITADGIQGVNPGNTDGGGGGGAGGTVLIQSVNPSTPSISISAKGGAGLNSGYNDHGPGGGGGGGYIAYQGFTPTTNVSGALPGNDVAGTNGSVSITHNPAADPYGAAPGTDGIAVSTAIPAAQVKPGASCLPLLTVTKTTSTPTVILPTSGNATATYTIVASNSSTTGSAANVSISDLLPSPNFTYASTASITLSGGATRTTVTNPTGGSTNPTWGSFTIPSGGQVQITFSVTVSSTATLGTYQNPATATYSDPLRTVAGTTTTASYNPASSTGEDVTLIASTPKLELVKRITNVTRGGVSISPSGSDNFSIFNDDPSTTVDNDPKWPSPNTYLIGAINGGSVAPSDRLEYTIYFLSAGTTDITNVTICDLVPANTTFVNNTYNGQTPIDTGSSGGNLGLALASNSAVLPTAPTVYTSSAIDGDRGSFYPAGIIPTPNPCSRETTPGSGTYVPISTTDNANGLVTFNIVKSPTIIPKATSAGNPADSYGFVRFAVTVN